MQDANKLNRKIYTHSYDHQMQFSDMVSKLIIDRNSMFNRNDLKTIFADCKNAVIIQK